MIPGEVAVVEANIDDMQGEFFGYLMEKLLEAGALDVTYAPVTMKKSRPGVQVSVICTPENEEAIAGILLMESTTLGVRASRMKRYTLEREFKAVDTEFGPIRVKIAGGRARPEYEDCANAARKTGKPLWEIFRAAELAYADIAGDSET